MAWMPADNITFDRIRNRSIGVFPFYFLLSRQLKLYGEVAHAERGQTRSLGGYLRLSGTPDGSLTGENMVLARVVMARRIGEMPVGLGGAVRVGFSLETGAVSPGAGLRLANLPREGWKQAISGFLSVDTRFGPFFLALGSTRGGDTSAYLLLGPTW